MLMRRLGKPLWAWAFLSVAGRVRDRRGEVGGAAPHRPVSGRQVDQFEVAQGGHPRRQPVTPPPATTSARSAPHPSKHDQSASDPTPARRSIDR